MRGVRLRDQAVRGGLRPVGRARAEEDQRVQGAREVCAQGHSGAGALAPEFHHGKTVLQVSSGPTKKFSVQEVMRSLLVQPRLDLYVELEIIKVGSNH